MSDIICVTNRALCEGDFLTRIEAIASLGPRAIMLREKDLPPAEYESLARSVMDICRRRGVSCILHSFSEVAARLGATALHLPLHSLAKMRERDRRRFSVIGASCHSEEDAKKAEALGCGYITFGHVFQTQCKPGLLPRGLLGLQRTAASVTIPVYAIGGVDCQNISLVRKTAASGACLMSTLMKCRDIPGYWSNLHESCGTQDSSETTK